jgi:hypothetical protein
MIPTETSRNLCNAIIHAGAERRIRTMNGEGNAGVTIRSLLQTKCDREQSDENDCNCERDEVCAKKICLERSNGRAHRGSDDPLELER